MAKDVIIRISATDAASPTFRRIAGEARSMGATVTQASETSSRSMEGFNKRAAALGAAIGSATLLMGEFTRAAAEDEASTARLQASIEATGASYIDYADAVDKAIKKGQDKAYSDDKVRDALVKLTTATGSTQAALSQMGLAMDLARARGIDMATAADIIGRVYNGNTGILTRYGLAVSEGATATEALAQLQTRVAGQADAYANTTMGAAERTKIAFDEATEAIGRHAGAAQSLLMILPGLQAGYAALAGIIGGFSGSGALGLAAGGLQIAGIGALGAIGYGYAKDDVGTTFANELANKIFLIMSQMINAAIPGADPFDTSKYPEQMAVNANWDKIIATFGSTEAAAAAFGVMGTTTTVEGLTTIAGETVNNPDKVTYTPPSNDEIYAAIVAAAAAGNMTVAQYLATPKMRGAAIGTYFRTNAVAGQGNVYGTGGAPLASTPYNVYGDRTRYDAGPYSGKRGMHVDYLAESYGSMAAYGTASYMATPGYAEAQRAAEFKRLQGQYGGFAGVVQGIDSQHDVTTAFNAAQGNVLQQEAVYGGQISEYTQQMNALTDAYDILTKRKEEGIALSKEEQSLLDNYPGLYERVSGGVEDATVQQGLLAAAYIENMKIGDQMNQNLEGTNSAVEDLSYVLSQYILLLGGVPDDVKTEILLNNADRSIEDLIRYYNWLNSIPGSVTTVVETQFVTGSGGGGAYRGPGMNGLTMSAFAAGGTMHGGGFALVGERGPELTWLPNGAQVMNTEGTKSRMRGSGGITINGPITVYANDPVQFSDALRSRGLAEARY